MGILAGLDPEEFFKVAESLPEDIDILNQSPFFNDPEPVYFDRQRVMLIGLFAAFVLLLGYRLTKKE